MKLVATCGLLAAAIPFCFAQSLDAQGFVFADTTIHRSESTDGSAVSGSTVVDGEYSGSYYAWAEYGKLHAYSRGSNAGLYGMCYSGSSAYFDDYLTFGGGVGTGYFMVDMTLEGSVTQSLGGFPTGGITWSNNPNGVTYYDLQKQKDKTTAHGLLDVTFTFGKPVEFWAQLNTLITFDHAVIGESIADFSNTALLHSIQVLDSNGNDVKNWTVTTASGQSYIPGAQAAPEPASIAALSLGALALRRRSKGR
jgi:hypothetical protein